MFAHSVRSLRVARPVLRRLQSTVVPPASSTKTIPSAKGVLFGFFAGASVAGLGCYYYVMEEYKATSSAIVADVLKLQKAVQTLDQHVSDIEVTVAKK